MGRTKDAVILLRVTPGDKAIIKRMAAEARQTVSAFVLARVWGEVTEPAAEPAKVSPIPAPKSGLAAALSIPGVRLGCDAFAGRPAELQPEAPPAEGPRRAFNPARRTWYRLAASGEWFEVLKDTATGQVFLVANGRAAEYPTVEAASGAAAAGEVPA